MVGRDASEVGRLRDAYGRILRYLLTVAADGDARPFPRALATEVDPKAKDDAMGLLDSMLEKGRAEGRAEGTAEGLAKGRAEARKDTLEKLLRMKFRSLPADVSGKIAVLGDDEVERALEAVLAASTIEDVLPR